MKKYFIITALFMSLISASAQGPADALLNSRYYYGGTARFNAMSGAFGALGGDFSSLSTNPAGLGVYRTSEFVFTTGINFTENKTEFLPSSTFDPQTTSIDKQSSLNIGNIGYVGTYRSGKSSGLISLSWAIGMNRLHDFNRNSFYSVRGNSTSLTDVMAAETSDDYYNYGLTPDVLNYYSNGNRHPYLWDKSSNWRNVLGWDVFATDYSGTENSPYESILLKETTTNQDKYVAERGAINEWAFSFGGNVNHMLYFGATLGVQSLYYTRTTSFNESFVSGLTDGTTYSQYDTQLDEWIIYQGGSLQHNEYLKTTGTGVNLKAGVIFRPIGLLRLGLAVHTPTLYTLRDSYYQNMFANDIYYPKGLDNNGDPIDIYQDFAETPDGISEYRLTTPLRTMASAALVFGKVGLVSAEYELVDYGMASLSARSGSTINFANSNTTISNVYGLSHGFKLGTEIQLSRFFKVRGGAAYYTSPLKSSSDDELQVNDLLSFSGGVGIRTQSFFMDLSYVFRTSETEELLYNYSGTSSSLYDPVSKNTAFDSLASLTFGFKF